MTVFMVTVAMEQMCRTIIVRTRGPRVVKVQTSKENKGSPWRREIRSEQRWRNKDGGYGFIMDPVIQGLQTLSSTASQSSVYSTVSTQNLTPHLNRSMRT